MPDQNPPTQTAADQPITMGYDGNGEPLPQSTVAEDRKTLTAILTATAGTLNTTYATQTSSELALGDVGQLDLFIEWTKGSADDLRIEFLARHASKGTTYNEVSASTSSGVSTLSLREYKFTGATGNFYLQIPVDGINFGVVRAKITGSETNNAVTIYATRAVSGV